MEVSTDNSLRKMLQQSEDYDNYTNNYFPFWNQQNYEPWNLTNNSNITTSNVSISNNNGDDTIKKIYQVVVPTLLICCIISIAINIRILITTYWIRIVSPTLRISLSLAGADAYTSLVFGTGLVVNSLLPIGFDIEFENICFALFLETQRLAGIIVTVAHLLTLACNHYLGILRPLHYLSIMTHRNTTICIILLWVLPIIFFLTYFSSIEGQGFQSEYCQKFEFMKQLKFRSIFSTLFFVPLALMIVIYLHIFIIVRKHQVNRLRMSQINHGSRHHSSSNGKSATTSNHQQMVRNVKAIFTTLLILGSFIIGWMPAVLTNLLFCDDCIFQLNSFNKYAMVFFHFVVNLLIIVKTLLNPIIYAARMHEIKIAIPRMQASLCRWCWLFKTDGDSESSDRSQQSHHRLSQYYGSNSNHLIRNNTTVYRMHSCPGSASNGNPQMHELLQRRSTRGHYHRRRDDHSTDL